MNIEFVNSSKSTRGGFKHETEVVINNEVVHRSVCHYINRTWERYTYQSVMIKAMDEMIDEERSIIRDEVKRSTGRKRLPKDYPLPITDRLNALIEKRKSL